MCIGHLAMQMYYYDECSKCIVESKSYYHSSASYITFILHHYSFYDLCTNSYE